MAGRNPNFSKWIRRFLAEEPPRSKSIVVTIFGDSIAPRGGAAWLGSLIDVLAPFGINDRLVRTSVFRLAEEGWLESRREGRRSLYRLTSSGLRHFEHAYRRIYNLPSRQWDGRWTLALLPRAPNGAAERAELRRELEWEGFGLIAPGVFGHPAADLSALADILQGLELQDKVFVISATNPDGFAGRPIRDLIGQCWNLGDLVAGYHRFLARFAPMLELFRTSTPPAPEQAFLVRTLLIHSFRRVILHDPRIPAEMLPEDWPGHAAYELCRDLYRLSYRQAELYLTETLGGADGVPAEAAHYFYERFGGLR